LVFAGYHRKIQLLGTAMLAKFMMVVLFHRTC
jgi:hypothetical protein